MKPKLTWPCLLVPASTSNWYLHYRSLFLCSPNLWHIFFVFNALAREIKKALLRRQGAIETVLCTCVCACLCVRMVYVCVCVCVWWSHHGFIPNFSWLNGLDRLSQYSLSYFLMEATALIDWWLHMSYELVSTSRGALLINYHFTECTGVQFLVTPKL